jgi:hypothetical protein
MRPGTITLSLTALALGSVLAAAPALAQTVGRPANDGGQITMPGNQSPASAPQTGNQSAPGGDYYAPQTGYQSNNNLQMNAQGEQGTAASDCAARFRSYNPATGTYLGFDGRRHSCP